MTECDQLANRGNFYWSAARPIPGRWSATVTSIRTFRTSILIIACALLVATNALAAQASPGAPIMLSPSAPGSDDWEPAVAADLSGNVYALWIHQTGGNPSCSTCRVAMLSIYSNITATWGLPHLLTPVSALGDGQFDPQIVVDPMDGKTVYASFLQNTKSSVVVMKSTDSGATWSGPVVANHTGSNTDKPTLVVRGQDIYVAYSNSSKTYVSASHDGGQTFASVVLGIGTFGCSLSSGGGVDSALTVYFSWVGYSDCFNSTGSATLYITKSTDGGQHWQNTILDTSTAAYACSQCGWQFLGAQITMTIGKSKLVGNPDVLYALWNRGTVDQGPEQIFFASSFDGFGWSASQPVSLPNVEAAFPSITTSGAAGDVRIAWMDTQKGPWNVYYQTSSSGGSTWTPAVPLSGCTTLSSPPTCPPYAIPSGFGFPYGDYFKLAVSGSGQTQAVWGEGPNWTGPGNIWYTSVPNTPTAVTVSSFSAEPVDGVAKLATIALGGMGLVVLGGLVVFAVSKR
jgi:hypothetical protein